jgi:ATP-dependent exoDNAse (exonuclease V) alpha subunit
LSYFEKYYAEARITVNQDTQTVNTGNLSFAIFTENTSREFDPQLHCHAVCPNLTKRPDGEWRAITNEQFHFQKMFVGQIYRNALAEKIGAMGLAVTPKPKGLFEIKGVPQDLIDLYSTRSEQISKALPKLREMFPAARESVLKALASERSRQAKIKMSDEELQSYWQAKWEKLGYDKNKLLEQIMQAKKQEKVNENTNHADLAAGVLTEEESVLTREDILKLGLQYSLGKKTIEDVEKDLALSEQILDLEKGKMFTTREMQEVETAIVEHLAKGESAQQSLVARQGFMIMPAQKVLTADQEKSVLHILESRDQVRVVQGDAGSGKTTMLEIVARNYSRAGYDVVPVSPTSLAAEALRAKGLIKASTVDAFLTQKGNNTRRQLLVVDEASLLGSKKFHELLKRTKSSDAVLLVGDAKQRASIDAGAIFGKVQEKKLAKVVRMQENIRQKDPLLQKAVRELADKNVDEALSIFDKCGRFREIPDSKERFEAVVEKYLDLSERNDTLVVTESNEERRQLNQLIREKLKVSGHLSKNGRDVYTTHPKNIALGERNMSFSYEKGDRFFLSRPVGDFGKGSYGEILSLDHDNNTATATITFQRRVKKVTVDLSKQGHYLSTYTAQKQEFAKGDKVIFLKSDKKVGVENGRMGRVLDCKEDGALSVLTNGDKAIDIKTRDYAYLDHGYAVTNFKSQSQEAHAVIYQADTRRGVSYNSLYVSASRAREDMHIYTNDKGQFAQQAQVEQQKTSTLDYVPSKTQSREMGLGIELDPTYHFQPNSEL